MREKEIAMKKNTLKYIIDVTLFINICSIAAIGLLMGFVIPAGKRFSPEEKFFLGLHRHDWGIIHLYLSVFLLVLLTLHVWLNWTWIVQSTKRYFGEKWKKSLYLFSGAWLIVLFIAWVFMFFGLL